MIVAVADDKNGHGQARGFSLSTGTLDWTHQVLRVDRPHCLLEISKRIVHVLEDLVLRLSRRWTILLFAYHYRRLLSQNAPPIAVMRGRTRVHCLREVPSHFQL